MEICCNRLVVNAKRFFSPLLAGTPKITRFSTSRWSPNLAIFPIWVFLLYWFSFDSAFISVSIILSVCFYGVGQRRIGSFSGYNIFTRGGMRLLGDTTPEQVEGEVRGGLGRVDRADPQIPKKATGFQTVKNPNGPCDCGSGRKLKKCCAGIDPGLAQANAQRRLEEEKLREFIDGFRI